MLSAKDAREFVLDTDSTWHTMVLDSIITALYHGRMHAELSNVYFTESEKIWLEELGYKVHVTSSSIYLYWA